MLALMSKRLPFEDPESGPDYRRMARAIRFLAEHYRDQPRLEEAAASAGLSPFHFQRLFTRYVGVSPKSFVGHLTLEQAKSDLAAGASVLDAALDAGLSGPSRLHDLALKIEAMTPGDYAKGGAGLTITYGFHPCPFGIALVMATPRGLCGLGFGDEGEDKAMLADMQSRWPRAHFVEDDAETAAMARRIFAATESDAAARPASARHALADQGVAGAACDPQRQGYDLWQSLRGNWTRRAPRARSAPPSAAIRFRC